MSETHTPQPDHTKITDQFSDYYDGELDAGDRATVEAHLEDCETCREEYDSFRTSLDALHALGQSFAPDDFVRQVTTDINRQSRGTFFKETWLLGFRIPYEAFAAVLLAIIGALYVFGPGNPETLQIVDVVDEEETAPTQEDRMGSALGSASHEVTLSVPVETDLGEVTRGLRNAGFSVRPEVTDAGEAVRASLPPDHAARFAETLRAMTPVNAAPLLEAAAKTKGPAIVVRVMRAP